MTKMANINKHLSIKVKTLSFIAIIGVLLIHTTYMESTRWSWLWNFQKYLSNLSNCAVPFFFIISGYFYFLKVRKIHDISRNIKKRFKTLLLPYTLWCLIFMCSVAIAGYFIELNVDYFEKLRNDDAFGFLSYCFWTPAAFHLWYVRDLFIIVLLSPIIYFPLFRYPLLTVIAAYLIFGVLRLVPVISWGLWWFIAGASFSAIHKPLLFSLKPLQSYILLFIGLISVGICQSNRLPLTPEYAYTIPIISICILGFWGVYDTLPIKSSISFVAIEFTFCIYCAHIPLLTFIKKLFYPILSTSWTGCLIGYILSPAITISILVCFFYLIRKYLPKSYEKLSGGR